MNIAEKLTYWAQENPDKNALVVPSKTSFGKYTYKTQSFLELDTISGHLAYHFHNNGIKKGMKVLLFVRPSLNFPAVVFSLFKLGAIPIMIDPGMGKKNLLTAVEEVSPEALIAEPEVFLLKKFYPTAFKSIEYSFTTGSFTFSKTLSLKKIIALTPMTFITEKVGIDQTAAILFTSGGTGTPKGVIYTHRIFNEQTKLLQDLFQLTPDDIDIPGFPLFSLFAIAMGMTSCPPDMNPSRPSKANPKKLIKNINDNQGTFVAGSPAIWERVADYAIKKGLVIESVKYLVMFGAPVSGELHEKFKKVLKNGETYTPYGATESLPVSCISGSEVLKETIFDTRRGKGTCVGAPVPSVSVKIIKVTDEVIVDLRDAEILTSGEVGEILVSGDVVTKKYFERPEATALAKIYESTADRQKIWHRIGDLGYFDSKGRLWFCGRKGHRVNLPNTTLYSVCCEAIFNIHPLVNKTALISNKGNPALVIELKGKKKLSHAEKKKFEKELLELGSKETHTHEIKKFFYHNQFPVDVRHNIKIDRIKLSKNFAEE